MVRHRSSKLLLAALTAFVVFASPQFVRGDGHDNDHDSGNSIVGTWALTVPHTPFQINRTFFANGTNVDASTFTPVAPRAAGALILSDGHGAWKKIGRNKYSVTLFFFQINPYWFQLTPPNPAAVLDTYGRVRETVTIRNGVYTGVFETDYYDPNGSLRAHITGLTTQGTLIPAEPAS